MIGEGRECFVVRKSFFILRFNGTVVCMGNEVEEIILIWSGLFGLLSL